jgi:putative FmdB family regulatory protein
MPTYTYKCSGCEKNYLEHRDITHPQSFTNCDVCGAAYVEVTE